MSRRNDRPKPARPLSALTAWLAPVLLLLVLVGPALVGQQVFAAGDLIDRNAAPWTESSTVEEITNVCVSDTVDSTLPSALVFRDRVADGDLAPLWDNTASAGALLGAAPPQGTSSPIFLATLPFSDTSFTAWMKVLETAVVLAGTVLWARRLGLGAAAGAVGGLVYAFGGFMVMWTNWPQSRTAAFLPLLFWALERIVQDRTLRSALPLPLVVAALVLGGFPTVVVYGVYFAAVYAVVRLVAENRRRARLPEGPGADTRSAWRDYVKPPVLAAGGGALGALLVAFQLVPWFNQLTATDLSYRENMWAGTFSWGEFLTVAYPQALGTCASDALRWGSVIPVEGVSFVGAGALVLVVAALVLPAAGGRMAGARPVFLLGGLLTLAVTFVGGTLNYVLHLLPLMATSPMHRMRSVGILMFAMLAAAGFDAVRRSAGERRWLPWTGVVAAVAALVLAALAVYRLAPTPEAWAQARTPLVVGLACGAGVAVAWAWIMAGAPGRRVAAALIPLALLVDALAFTTAYWPRSEPETFYRETTTGQFLTDNLGTDRMVGVGYAYWNGANKVAGVRSLSGHTFVPAEWKELLDQVDPTMFLTPTNHTLNDLSALDSPALDRLAVRYAVMDTTMVPPGQILGVEDQDRAAPVTLQDTPGQRDVPAGTALRGVVVELTEPVGDVDEDADPTRLVAEVLDGTGKVLATGERRVRDGAAGVQMIPVDGEELAQLDESYQVRVSAEGQPSLRVVGSTAPGQGPGAWVGVLTADDSGLDLVHTSDAQVVERAGVLPRFRWAGESATCETAAECVEAMGEISSATVLLDAADAATAFDGEPAEVRVEVDDDDLQRVRVNAQGGRHARRRRRSARRLGGLCRRGAGRHRPCGLRDEGSAGARGRPRRGARVPAGRLGPPVEGGGRHRCRRRRPVGRPRLARPPRPTTPGGQLDRLEVGRAQIRRPAPGRRRSRGPGTVHGRGRLGPARDVHGCYCPWAAYFASTAAFCGRHQSSLSRYQAMVSSSPERKSLNSGSQPSSSRRRVLSMA
nr:hypothetical protein DA06_01395 [Georgenia sp. SUBG003]